jgi:hypothetical protein
MQAVGGIEGIAGGVVVGGRLGSAGAESGIVEEEIGKSVILVARDAVARMAVGLGRAWRSSRS